MKRARLIIKEVQVTKQGEIKNFQIKLPKNVQRVIAIDTDIRIDSRIDVFVTGGIRPEPRLEEKVPFEPIAIGSDGTRSAPFLSWTLQQNPVTGKLKLKSMERTYIFYEEWLHFILFNGGIPDMTMGMFVRSPISLNKNRIPKKVDVPVSTTIVNGIYEDTLGKFLQHDITYTIKVFVWMETEEENDGVVFDFQDNEITTEKKETEEHG
ncbi:MAG: hypothetical protein ACJ77K_18580 [Bacteroidia bacterium]